MNTEKKIEPTTQSLRGDSLKEKTTSVFLHEEVSHIYSIYLTDSFPDPRFNLDALHTIRSCDDIDRVNIYLNNYGGDTATGTQLLNSLKQCKAKEINIYVDAPLYSMAPIFVVGAFKNAGAGIVLGEDIMFMFHNYSSRYGGKGHEVKAHILADEKLYSESDYNQLYPFLSTAELKSLQDGADIYLMKKEITDRLENLANFMSNKDYYDGDKLVVRKKTKKDKTSEI